MHLSFTIVSFCSAIQRILHTREAWCLCAVVRRDVTARGGGLGVERDDVAAFVGGCDLRHPEPAGHDVWGNEEVGLQGWLDVA